MSAAGCGAPQPTAPAQLRWLWAAPESNDPAEQTHLGAFDQRENGATLFTWSVPRRFVASDGGYSAEEAHIASVRPDGQVESDRRLPVGFEGLTSVLALSDGGSLVAATVRGTTEVDGRSLVCGVSAPGADVVCGVLMRLQGTTVVEMAEAPAYARLGRGLRGVVLAGTDGVSPANFVSANSFAVGDPIAYPAVPPYVFTQERRATRLSCAPSACVLTFADRAASLKLDAPGTEPVSFGDGSGQFQFASALQTSVGQVSVFAPADSDDVVVRSALGTRVLRQTWVFASAAVDDSVVLFTQDAVKLGFNIVRVPAQPSAAVAASNLDVSLSVGAVTQMTATRDGVVISILASRSTVPQTVFGQSVTPRGIQRALLLSLAVP